MTANYNRLIIFQTSFLVFLVEFRQLFAPKSFHLKLLWKRWRKNGLPYVLIVFLIENLVSVFCLVSRMYNKTKFFSNASKTYKIKFIVQLKPCLGESHALHICRFIRQQGWTNSQLIMWNTWILNTKKSAPSCYDYE